MPAIQGHNDPPQCVRPSTGLSSRGGGERQGSPKPPNFLSQPYPAVPVPENQGSQTTAGRRPVRVGATGHLSVLDLKWTCSCWGSLWRQGWAEGCSEVCAESGELQRSPWLDRPAPELCSSRAVPSQSQNQRWRLPAPWHRLGLKSPALRPRHLNRGRAAGHGEGPRETEISSPDSGALLDQMPSEHKGDGHLGDLCLT